MTTELEKLILASQRITALESEVRKLEAARDDLLQRLLRSEEKYAQTVLRNLDTEEKAERENALLLKALESVRPSCRAPGCWCPESLGYADDRRHSDACIAARAALARIQEARPPHE